MTKEVLVKISGLQMAGREDSDAVEVITTGTYYKKNDKHYVLYDEIMEESGEVTKNRIKIGTDFMEVGKKGEASLQLLFEKNKKNRSYYYTPFGNLLIGTDTQEIQIEEKESKIHVKVNYKLEINYEHVADCYINVEVTSKQSRDFKL